MARIRDISIRNKLVLIQMFTSILVLGLCFAAFVVTDIKGYKERKVNSMISLAKVIGSNCVSALQFLDNETARDNLRQVSPDVVHAEVFDAKGRSFAVYARTGKSTGTVSPPAQAGYKFDGDFLYVYTNIVALEGKIGMVCLQVELVELEQIKSQKFQIAALLLAVGLGFAFLIAWVNQAYVSAPVLNLVKVMKQIRESSDYNRHVHAEGRDEIGALYLEFNNLMDEVVSSHQKKDEFIGIASHELKTPLTSIKLYLEALERIEKEQPGRAFVLKARENVNKLQNLIRDLLDVSRIHSGQLQLNLRETDLEKLIDDCIHDAQIGTFRHTVVREGIATHTMVTADRDRLEQVMVNLISNAIKYSPDDKSVIIRTRMLQGEIEVSVTDFGIGIPKQEQKRVFERFYRAKGSNTVNSGFGLGLYICSQIIKRHGGRIWVTSEEGQGSTFFFKLPVSQVNQ